MQTQQAQNTLQLLNLLNVAKTQIAYQFDKIPKINIETVTPNEAQVYAMFYFLSGSFALDAIFSQELIPQIETIRKDIAQYIDILPRIAEGKVGEAEMEDYILKKMHLIRTKKSNKILASKI